MSPEQEQWLTLGEVCEILKVGKYTLWKMRQSGEITDSYPRGRPPKGVRGNIFVRIARSEVDRYMRRGMINNDRG